MSHFSVVVCLDMTGTDKVEARLAEVMAPWDENREMEPYRDYEEGAPGDFWWVKSVRRGADSHARYTELGHPAFLFKHADEVRVDEWRDKGMTRSDKLNALSVEWAEDAQWAARLGDNPTWADVVAAYNEKYHHGAELATPGDTSDSETMFVDDEGRAYTMSTYNPESKWDYWRIGGRWREYFIAAAQPAAAGRIPAYVGLIQGSQDWDSPKPKDGPVRCDGGPKRLLDFDAMRDDAATQANERYDQWEKICADTPVALPWSHFIGLVEAKDITIDQAREQYNAQPRIAAARAADFERWSGCIVEEFVPDREEYVTNARNLAVPGYALVTLDGQWMAPGRMGWFGMSSDGPDERAAYAAIASRYLDDLGPDRYVVVLDCHI